jgi:hypothetical protein
LVLRDRQKSADIPQEELIFDFGSVALEGFQGGGKETEEVIFLEIGQGRTEEKREDAPR